MEQKYNNIIRVSETSIGEDNMDKYWYNLAIAIVLAQVDYYREEVDILNKLYESGKTTNRDMAFHKGVLADIELFFRSNWCALLSGMEHPSVIIEKLKKEKEHKWE